MHNTAYELRMSDWSSDVCSSDFLRDVARNVPIGVFDRMLQGEGRFLLLGRMLVSESGDVPVAERKALGISQNERVFEATRAGAAIFLRHLVGQSATSNDLRSEEPTSELKSLMRISYAVY